MSMLGTTQIATASRWVGFNHGSVDRGQAFTVGAAVSSVHLRRASGSAGAKAKPFPQGSAALTLLAQAAGFMVLAFPFQLPRPEGRRVERLLRQSACVGNGGTHATAGNGPGTSQCYAVFSQVAALWADNERILTAPHALQRAPGPAHENEE